MAESGRVATFQSGGEFPVVVPQGLGTVAIEYKEFGTRVDFVPYVVGNGVIKLQVRPQISEIDNARAVTISGTRVPGLRTRWVDTAVEMKAGQTFALAGLIQERVEAQTRGLPWISELPYFGVPFRKVREERNQIELLVMVTPQLVDALDPHEVPNCGPGETTTSPNDVDLYFRGYLEVPRCCPDGTCSSCQTQAAGLAPPIDQSQPTMVYPHPSDAGNLDAPATGAGWPSARNLNNRQNSNSNPRFARANARNSNPGLVGGAGYDLINNNR